MFRAGLNYRLKAFQQHLFWLCALQFAKEFTEMDLILDRTDDEDIFPESSQTDVL